VSVTSAVNDFAMRRDWPTWVLLAGVVGLAVAWPDVQGDQPPSTEPCSIPENPDPTISYPFFRQCTNNRCPVCTSGRPAGTTLWSGPNLSRLLLRRPQGRDGVRLRDLDRVNDTQEDRNQPLNITLTSSPIFGGVIPEADTTLLQDQPQRTMMVPDFCSSIPWLPEPEVFPHQCPTTFEPEVVPKDTIIGIILETGTCTRAEECRHSVSELLLRLRFLLEKIERPLLLLQTKYRAQLIMFRQISAEIEATAGRLKGSPGPPGDHGLRGHRGPRGRRGPEGKCDRIGRATKRMGLPGPMGIPGPIGLPGNQQCGCDGAQGPPGYYGYTTYGYEGPKGHKGLKGPPGLSPIDHYG